MGKYIQCLLLRISLIQLRYVIGKFVTEPAPKLVVKYQALTTISFCFLSDMSYFSGISKFRHQISYTIILFLNYLVDHRLVQLLSNPVLHKQQ